MTSTITTSTGYTAPIFSDSTYTSSTNSASSSASKSSSGALTESDFLILLTTELKDQDPTNPQSSSDFVAQLATFSTLAGQTQMTSTTQESSAVSMMGMQIADNQGDTGIVSGVSIDPTNGVELTITQTGGTTKIVNFSNITSVSYNNGGSSSGTSGS